MSRRRLEDAQTQIAEAEEQVYDVAASTGDIGQSNEAVGGAVANALSKV